MKAAWVVSLVLHGAAAGTLLYVARGVLDAPAPRVPVRVVFHAAAAAPLASAPAPVVRPRPLLAPKPVPVRQANPAAARVPAPRPLGPRASHPTPVPPAALPLLDPAPPPPPEAVAPPDDKAAVGPGVVVHAALLSYPKPRYPSALRARGVTGTVELRVTLSAEGRVRDVVVSRSSGYQEMDSRAAAAARAAQYAPGTVDSHPVEDTVSLTVHYELE